MGFIILTWILMTLNGYTPGQTAVPQENPPILFLTNLKRKEASVDRWWFDVADTYIRESKGKSFLWGEGFDGYKSEATLKDNIIAQYESLKKFTAIMIDVPAFQNKSLILEVKEISKEIIVVAKAQECWQEKCISEVKEFGTKILMLAFGKEAAELAYSENANFKMIVHSPNTASESLYTPVDDKERKFGAILTGSTSDIYPLCQRWDKIIKSGNIPRATSKPSKTYTELQRHKIALFSSSVFNYQVPEFAEAAMAGALIISTVPDDDPNFWREHIVKVNGSMSNTELAEVVNHWLDHDKERIEKAQEAQKAVLSKYTTMHSVRLLVKAINRYRSNVHGTIHDYPFINSCSAVNSTHHSNKHCVDRKTRRIIKNQEL